MADRPYLSMSRPGSQIAINQLVISWPLGGRREIAKLPEEERSSTIELAVVGGNLTSLSEEDAQALVDAGEAIFVDAIPAAAGLEAQIFTGLDALAKLAEPAEPVEIKLSTGETVFMTSEQPPEGEPRPAGEGVTGAEPPSAGESEGGDGSGAPEAAGSGSEQSDEGSEGGDDLAEAGIAELRVIAEELGVSKGGSKEEIAERIREARAASADDGSATSETSTETTT